MSVTSQQGPRIAGLLIFLLPLVSVAARFETYVPDPDEVIFRLAEPAPAALRSDQDPLMLMDEVERMLRASPGGRQLALVETRLAPLLDRFPRARILNARALQARHAFDDALKQLDLAESAGLRAANLYLQRAMIHRVQGRFAEALEDCLSLVGMVDATTALLCSAPVRGLSGQLDQSIQAMSTAPESARADIEAWRYSELAESLARRGDAAQSLHSWRIAVALEPDNRFYRIALAQQQLANGQWEPARKTAGDITDQPAAQIVGLIAERKLGISGWRDKARALRTDLERALTVHDSGAHRELAQLSYELLDEPESGAHWALENWSHQREPADVLLLARAARTSIRAGDALRSFLSATGYQDARLDHSLNGNQAS